MFMCMYNILLNIDIIPNDNYYVFLHFRGACIQLICLLFADVM